MTDFEIGVLVGAFMVLPVWVVWVRLKSWSVDLWWDRGLRWKRSDGGREAIAYPFGLILALILVIVWKARG